MFNVLNKEKRQLFERTILPHLDMAYNLARWLVPNSGDAEDITQEAYMKAFRLFKSYNDLDGKAWILTIVRNTCYTWIKKNNNARARFVQDVSEEELEKNYNKMSKSHCFLDPSDWLAIESDVSRVYRAIDQLHLNFKEIIVLRDIEGCNYKEISEILGIPPGTVMSRLSRARVELQDILAVEQGKQKRSEEEV